MPVFRRAAGPDLIIRTSGEQRISNYLTFQSAYSELYHVHLFGPTSRPKPCTGLSSNMRAAIAVLG